MRRERKETFTYSTSRKSRNKAMKKAKKEGITLSSKINEWIEDYIKEPDAFDNTFQGIEINSPRL